MKPGRLLNAMHAAVGTRPVAVAYGSRIDHRYYLIIVFSSSKYPLFSDMQTIWQRTKYKHDCMLVSIKASDTAGPKADI